jgi:tetratricopeptide (TPR) repeat protein
MCPSGSLDRFRLDGELHLLARQPGLALRDFTRCLELDAANLEAHTALGRILLGDEDARLADYELALTHTEKAFALEHNADTRWNLARNYYALERWSEALVLFEEYVAAYPQNADAKYYLGIICYELGDLGRAQSLLIEAVALDPELRDEEVDAILRETGSDREQGKT